MQSIPKNPQHVRVSDREKIIVREVDGAWAVENYIQASWRNREDHNDIINSNTLNKFSRKLFGTAFSDTQPNDPAIILTKSNNAYDEDMLRELIEEYESQFLTAGAAPEEAVKILLRLGIDFRAEDGHPLNSTRYLQRQAEAAGRGIKGSLPDVELLRDEKLLAVLLDERELFEQDKRQANKNSIK